MEKNINTNITTVAYGSQNIVLHLPKESKRLSLYEPKPSITADLFVKKLSSFWQQKPLDLKRPVLVVADKTRLCGYPEYLPVLLSFLEKKGMQHNALRILIAYGTHPPQSEEECRNAYGEIYTQYDFIHHNCREKDNFIECGITQQQTPIRLRKDIANATALITMGAICHHYFAGYGGGRKLIFPGCGELEAIYANHSLFLDKEQQELAQGCQPGCLEKNPLAEDLFAVEDGGRTADLAIHGILDSKGKLADLHIGSGRQFFLETCNEHGKNCEVQSESFDVVIASCGGFPKDINFIQSHKAVHNAAMFVRDGGRLILYSECRDGVGSKTFLPYFQKGDLGGGFSTSFAQLAMNYEGNGGTALAMMAKSMRIDISLVTMLPHDMVELMGATLWSHQEVQNYLDALPIEKNVAFIGNASLLVRKI